MSVFIYILIQSEREAYGSLFLSLLILLSLFIE